MPGSQNYRHIEVAPAEEDDVIIEAGIADGKGTSSVPAVPNDSGGSEADGAQSAHRGATANAVTKGDEYRETTLEDIESSRMSSVQKAIIGCSVAAIAVFVVYVVFFM